MVNRVNINNILDNVIEKSKLMVVKCKPSTVARGEGATVHVTGSKGEKVPLRHLQDKGYDEDGNHLGYITDIVYPDGTEINYVEGTLSIDGKTYRMGFDTNYKYDSNGNWVENQKGGANEYFKEQFKAMDKTEQKVACDYGTLLARGSLVNAINDLVHSGVNINRRSVKEEFVGTPLGDLIINSRQMQNLIGNTRCDKGDIVVGEQIADNKILMQTVNTITTSKDTFTSTSVGFLNDKTLVARDRVTGDSRDINGRVNNWDNTWKVYTVINEGSGAKGVYLGYPQNVKAGVQDNSANPHNELTFGAGQNFKKMLVDKENKIIIQVPVGEPSQHLL